MPVFFFQLQFSILRVTFYPPDKASVTSRESNEVNGTPSFWIPKVITESIASNIHDETDTAKVIAERRSSHHSLTPSPEQSFGKKLPQYNSFRVMKQKVKQTANVTRGSRCQFKVFHIVIVGEEGFKTS